MQASAWSKFELFASMRMSDKMGEVRAAEAKAMKCVSRVDAEDRGRENRLRGGGFALALESFCLTDEAEQEGCKPVAHARA